MHLVSGCSGVLLTPGLMVAELGNDYGYTTHPVCTCTLKIFNIKKQVCTSTFKSRAASLCIFVLPFSGGLLPASQPWVCGQSPSLARGPLLICIWALTPDLYVGLTISSSRPSACSGLGALKKNIFIQR